MTSQHLSPVGPDGKVRCYVHNLEATLRTSHTLTNPNRQFYTCPLRADGRCKFFYWKNELPPPGNPAQMPSTPTRSPTTFTRFPPLATPTSPGTLHQSSPWQNSPTKRSSPFAAEEARQKRFKSIQEALKQDNSDPDDNSSSMAKVPSDGSPSSSPIPIDPLKDSKGCTGTTYRLSDLGFNFGLNRATHAERRNEALSGVNRYDSPRNQVDNDDDAKSEDELWKALTPPSSADEVTASLLVSKDKGKGKQKVEESEMEDGVNWFKDVPPTLTSPGLFSSMHSPITSSDPYSTSELSGNKIQHLVNGVITDLSGIPEYVQRLERRLTAMEKSNAAKMKRIRELEEDIRELKSPKKDTFTASK